MNIKKWVKDHWLHLAIGGAAVGIAALCISRINSDSCPTNCPFGMDGSNDSWMDRMVSHSMTCNGSPMTVRQIMAVGDLNEFIYEYITRNNILTVEQEIMLSDEFMETHPNATAVLNSMDGFWEYYAPDNFSVMDAK